MCNCHLSGGRAISCAICSQKNRKRQERKKKTNENAPFHKIFNMQKMQLHTKTTASNLTCRAEVIHKFCCGMPTGPPAGCGAPSGGWSAAPVRGSCWFAGLGRCRAPRGAGGTLRQATRRWGGGVGACSTSVCHINTTPYWRSICALFLKPVLLSKPDGVSELLSPGARAA